MNGFSASHVYRSALVHVPWLARVVAGGYGNVQFRLDHGRRAQLKSNLRAAFPGLTSHQLQQLCRRVFVANAKNRCEQRRFELLSEPQLERTVAKMEIRGRAYIEEPYLAGRPVVLVTPHYGNYMLGARCVAAAFPRHGVHFFYNPPERNAYAESSNRYLDRPHAGCHKIYNNAHGIKTALKALRAGGILCMMPDLISVTTSALYVPFFGRYFTAMAGIGFLALKSDALVVPCYCIPESGRTVMEFRPPLNDYHRAGELSEKVYAMMAELFRELERQISLRPEHWRYWHVFLKRSLEFPVPAHSVAHLLEQLRDERTDALIADDERLRGVVHDWTRELETMTGNE